MRKNKGVIFSELFKALKSKMDAILAKWHWFYSRNEQFVV